MTSASKRDVRWRIRWKTMSESDSASKSTPESPQQNENRKYVDIVKNLTSERKEKRDVRWRNALKWTSYSDSATKFTPRSPQKCKIWSIWFGKKFDVRKKRKKSSCVFSVVLYPNITSIFTDCVIWRHFLTLTSKIFFLIRLQKISLV